MENIKQKQGFDSQGVTTMRKDQREEEKVSFEFKQKPDEVLEISSTGYGLESVSTDDADAEIKTPPPCCGGL